MSSEPTPAPAPPNPPPPTPPPPVPPALPPSVGLTDDDKNMALLAHLLAIPLGFLGPLIIWLIKRDTSAFVADQGKEALNFQISVLLGFLITGVITLVTCGLGSPLLLAVIVGNLVLCILAALKAKDGVLYRYPLCLRLVT